MTDMSYRQMNLNIFRGEPVPHVLFQPRIEPWYDWHQTFDCMPETFRGMSIGEFFDDLDVSMRYVHYYTGMPSPIVDAYGPAVTIHEQFGEKEGTRVYETPHGDLVEQHLLTPDKTWRLVGFPVKTAADLKKVRWLYRHRTYRYVPEDFAQGSAFVGPRGEPQFWVPRSPYQALAIDWMRYEDFIYALVDCPDEVLATMQAIDQSYDPLYAQLGAADELNILNFGENVHGGLISPRYFQQHVLPWYEKRSGQLRAAGKFTHVHIDGAFTGLLPFLKDLPFDGIEALTPTPQGDVDLETMAAHIGDKILLDGIPAVLFMETYSREALMMCAEKLVELFHPRLVLGVSDEVPEGTGEEAMIRVRMIADWCKGHGGGPASG